MDPMDIIAAEARENRTVVLTAIESDGSSETREVEPYSLRPGGTDRPETRLFYYCLKRAASGTPTYPTSSQPSRRATPSRRAGPSNC